MFSFSLHHPTLYCSWIRCAHKTAESFKETLCVLPRIPNSFMRQFVPKLACQQTWEGPPQQGLYQTFSEYEEIHSVSVRQLGLLRKETKI